MSLIFLEKSVSLKQPSLFLSKLLLCTADTQAVQRVDPALYGPLLDTVQSETLSTLPLTLSNLPFSLCYNVIFLFSLLLQLFFSLESLLVVCLLLWLGPATPDEPL